jgi:hypothetical protein
MKQRRGLGWVQNIYWSESANLLLVEHDGPPAQLCALSWPQKTEKWSWDLPQGNQILTWNLSDKAVVIGKPSGGIIKLNHSDGSPIATPPQDAPEVEFPSESRVASGYSAHLDHDQCILLDESLRPIFELSLENVPALLGFLTVGAFGFPLSDGGWRIIVVYDNGYLVVDSRSPKRGRFVSTATSKLFGQVPFDEVPNPIDPLSKFYAVSPDDPKSLGSVTLPTFGIGAAAQIDDKVFMFGGPFYHFFLELYTESLSVDIYYAEKFSAHNHKPWVETRGSHLVVEAGQYKVARFSVGIDRLSRPILTSYTITQCRYAFTYIPDSESFITVSGWRGQEQDFEAVPESRETHAVYRVEPGTPGAPRFEETWLDL